MKKRLVLAMALILSASAVYSLGLGIQGGLKYSDNAAGGASLLISSNERSHFVVDWYLSDSRNVIGVALDYWPLYLTLSRWGWADLNLFLGVGVFGNFAFYGEDSLDVSAGLHIPIGLEVKVDRIHLFFQIAPAIAMNVIPGFEFGGVNGSSAAVGIRFFF